MNPKEVRDHFEEKYSEQKRIGLIRDFLINNVNSEHNLKNLKGRVIDWFKWKSPLRRWLRPKPKLVEVSLAEVLERYWDLGNFEELNLNDKEFEMLLRGAEGVTVWEWEYPTNPYENMIVDATIVPIVPINYIKVKLTTEPFNSEAATPGP